MKKSAFLTAGLVTLCVFLLAVLAFSEGSQIELDPPVAVIGLETPFRVQVENPHGVRTLTVSVEQNGVRHKIYEVSKDAKRNPFFRQDEPPQVFEFRAGQKQASALKDGQARLIIEAVSNDLRAKKDVLSDIVEINTRPPAVTADGAQHYINQGGSELVTFVPSGYWSKAGVRVGQYEFRSFPLPGNQGAAEKAEHFSLFAFPWDVPATEVPAVFVRNPSGAEVTGRFWFKVFPKDFRS
ncbi:MAG: M23 family peptidase, partial [Bryobacteraceae bacterium]